MEVQKRGGTKIILNHALDMIRNPSESCLPSSRPSLISCALEYGGALWMIRVSIFSNNLMTRVMPGGEAGAGLYSPKGPTGALGSNRLKQRRRCILGGRGKPT